MGTLARENFSDPDFPFRFKLERTASSESPKLELKNKEGERKGGGKKKERKRRKSAKKTLEIRWLALEQMSIGRLDYGPRVQLYASPVIDSHSL